MDRNSAGRHDIDRDTQAGKAGLPPGGRLYEAGGRRVMLVRAGQGGPAVVFVAGASAVGLDYLNIHQHVSQFTTSVLYDRGGTGWSDPAGLPRSGAEVARELEAALSAAQVPGPYLLAGHSLGGGYIRRFAQLYPAQVAGLLYLESFYEDADDYLPERLHLARVRQPDPGPLQLRLMRPAMRRMYSRMFADWPPDVRDVLISRHLSAGWWQAGVLERSSMVALAAELRQGGDIPDVPAIVLTAAGTDPGMRLLMSGKALRELADGKSRLFAALAAAGSHGQVRELAGARHSTMTTDRADAVVQAVSDLLGQVREAWPHAC
jgi:pimeloyl-ACP methyl ester carboxylesterase